ncbi:MAG: single-stranded-DNA-specific exonuclease RecJ [Firmicutes bacterium]|nr:single-stranded-DNA-specific exonuclease RecJ [Bacillota bacterium]
MAKWTLRLAPVKSGELAQKLNIDPAIARILAVRGYYEPEAAKRFLVAEEQALASPWLFADMDKAVTVIAGALAQGKKITVFGDYDADGIMSTVILYKTLSALGGAPDFYIPQREQEGYGLNNEAIRRLQEQGTSLLIACDNGISALEQVAYANSLGMEVVILDHHDVPLIPDGQGKERQTLPEAAAVVDAKRQDCGYPFAHYCAAGLCYRFSQALYERLARDWQSLAAELLPYAVIATVCDIVQLVDENRCLVRRGLPALAKTENVGLQALLAAAGIAGKELNAYHIGFVLGPCINASGRMEMAGLAVELFLTEDRQKAERLAEHLVALNNERRSLTEQGSALAFGQILEQGYDADKVIVLYHPDICESVAGIIAGRIKEKYYRPAVVLAGKKEYIRGSCRSVEGYNIYMALNQCADLLQTFGGHPLAAGLAIAPENIGELRRRLNEICALTDEDMQAHYRIDKALPVEQATLSLAKQLQRFEPFGKGNPPVYLADRRLRLVKITLLGKEEHVMRLTFRKGERGPWEAVCFNGKERLFDLLESRLPAGSCQRLLAGNCLEPPMLDIIYTLNVNVFNNRETAQIQISDFRLSEEEAR